MDRFSEQLLQKIPDKADYFKRGLIVAGEILVLFLLAMLMLWSGFTLIAFVLVTAAGSFWLMKYLWDGTSIEYEYIVTNDDLDVDKIIGRRKRKRMCTLSLRKVEDIAPYLNETEVNADVTVLAHDGTGEDLWYLLAQTQSSGKVLVLFNPNDATRRNIIGGLDPRVRTKLPEEIRAVALTAERDGEEAEEAEAVEEAPAAPESD